MQMSGNTILITGGSSGIGQELAKQLLALGNIVIVTGRNEASLAGARDRIHGLHTLQSDVSDPNSVRALYNQVVTQFPTLNVLINCAGIMRKIDLQATGDLEDLTREVQTNLSGTIWMNIQFLPHLKQMKNAAIVNVSSGLAFVPLPISPIYSATKAGVHAFTLSLRVQLKNTNVRVFEIAPPGTDTPLYLGDFTPEDVGGAKPMSVETLAKHVISGMNRDALEIRPGLANVLKLFNRIAPDFILKRLSSSVELMHTQAE